jgi:hypothetical protein
MVPLEYAAQGNEGMGRRKPTARSEFVLFNVIYEDGTVTSQLHAGRLYSSTRRSLDGLRWAAVFCRGPHSPPGAAVAAGANTVQRRTQTPGRRPTCGPRL